MTINKPPLTEEEELRRGELLAEVLELHRIRSGPDFGRYSTAWGSKAALGLYRTVERIILDGE